MENKLMNRQYDKNITLSVDQYFGYKVKILIAWNQPTPFFKLAGFMQESQGIRQ